MSAAGEAGFTLIELLVAATVLVVVMLATMNILDASTASVKRETERAHAIREAQVGLDRMVRELRHTETVHSSEAQLLDVTVVRAGIDRRVVFDCSVAHPTQSGARRCTRSVDGGPPAVLIDRVRDVESASGAFVYTPVSGDPKHVAVRLGLAVNAGRSDGYSQNLVLSDGVTLRNAG